MIPDPRERPTLTVWPETGGLLGLRRSATYEAIARGEIPVLRFGRTLRVPTARLRVLLGIDAEPAAPEELGQVVALRPERTG